jgi:hypothetical protein
MMRAARNSLWERSTRMDNVFAERYSQNYFRMAGNYPLGAGPLGRHFRSTFHVATIS